MTSNLRHRHFVLFVAVFVFSAPVLALFVNGVWSLPLAFDLAAVLFSVSVLRSMLDATPATIREHAERDDAGRMLLVATTAIALLIVLVTIALETRQATAARYAVPASLATLAFAWVFGNLVFTLQYAHRFYDRVDAGDRGGLAFPECETPVYADFLYFAFVVGMTFQVSDVTIGDSGTRRLCLAHALIAFFFTIGVIALSVNLLAGSG